MNLEVFDPIWDLMTPIQRRMLERLADGTYHDADELHQLLSDDLGKRGNIHSHLTGIRRYLLKVGMGLVTQRAGKSDVSYVLVILPKPAADLVNRFPA